MSFAPRPRADPVDLTFSAAEAVIDGIVADADAVVCSISARVTELLRPLATAGDRVVAAALADDRVECARALEGLKDLDLARAGPFARLAQSFDMTQRAITDRLDVERKRFGRPLASRRR